jgi:hypothetical protein
MRASARVHTGGAGHRAAGGDVLRTAGATGSAEIPATDRRDRGVEAASPASATGITTPWRGSARRRGVRARPAGGDHLGSIGRRERPLRETLRRIEAQPARGGGAFKRVMARRRRSVDIDASRNALGWPAKIVMQYQFNGG